MRERMKKKKNMIIGGLLALIFVMSVGYAAFATNLNISGTANTSSWIIKITNIREKTHTGGADTENTSFTDLSASFSSTLTQPGDSVTYEVTVENRGNIDASLKKVTKTFTQNKYIDVTYSGLLEGQMLYKQGQSGSTAVMEVTVTFKDIEIESLTDTITSNITISLDFEQEGNNVDTTKKYLVEYNSGGGSAVESKYVRWNEDDLISDIDTKEIGFDLVGWYTGPNGSGTRVTIVSEYADLVDHDETKEGVTIYAHWTPKNYLIKYDKQDGGTISSVSKSWTDSSLNRTVSRNGFTFIGWDTESNGTGLKISNARIQVKDVIEAKYGKYTDIAGGENGNEITLYASWQANDYTVQYDTQGGNEIPSIIAKWTDTITLPGNPTKEGYIFDGWWKKASGGTQITADMKVSQVASSANPAKPVILYAHWTQNE